MTILAIDGNSILNRAYYGVKPLSTMDGTPTHAVYGFLTILNRLQNEYTPDGVCVCFDLKAPTFRHQLYDGYKATRKPMDNDLAVQLPLIKQVLAAMHIPCYELAGYEADDLLGTISRHCAEQNATCLIATGDRDAYQLVNDSVNVLHISSRMGQTTTTRIGTAAIEQQYGLSPLALIDLKALMGDSSDNIPGVPGVGEKTALPLLQAAQSLDALYADLDNYVQRATLRDKLQANKDLALLSRQLGTIDTHAPIDFQPSDAANTAPDKAALYALCKKLEFTNLIKKWGLSESAEATPPTATAYIPCPVKLIDTPDAYAALLSTLTAPTALLLPPHEQLMALCDGDTTYIVTADAQPDGAALCAADFAKIVYDAKALYRRHPIANISFDLLLAAHLCNPDEKKLDLPRLALAQLDTTLPDPLFEDDTACGVLSGGTAESALAQWVSALHALHGIYAEKLSTLGLTSLHNDLELPLSAVLADMERTGIAVDRAALSAFAAMLKQRIADTELAAAQTVDEPINWQSPKQLGELLFVKLGLPAGKKTKSGFSTDIEVLEGLRGQHPLIEHIIELRHLTKLSATYAEGLQKVIAADGRIHTTFQMTATVTGRLSSVEPNLQNIPIRTEMGSELRRMFTCGSPNAVLIDADYSQIELRVLAHIADDKTMQAAFNAGLDIHTATACEIFGCEPEAVTPLMRRQAKAINFGIVYGMGDHALAQDLGISYAEAKQYRESYFGRFSGVYQYQKNIVEQAKEQGYVTTLLGRRRPLPELQSSNHNLRAFGERAALNAPIQGSAADIIKLAMLSLSTKLQQDHPDAKLVLQVHDELLVECPAEQVQAVAQTVKQCMERVMTLSVPLTADVGCGTNWQQAH